MVIDKTWTTLNRCDPAFWIGLQAFLAMASQHVDCDGRIKCPCVECLNLRLQTLDVVRAHVHRWGFQQSYQQWIYHGEVEVGVANEEVDDNDIDEMIDVIDDFLPLTNDEEVAGIDGSRMGRYYDELFEEIEAELYPGCNWISSLNFLAKLMHLKLKGKIPNNIFDELLKLLKFALPNENKIPVTHYEAKRKLSRLGLGYQSIHVCEHHCCLFYNEHASKDSCPVCGSSRWTNDEKKEGNAFDGTAWKDFDVKHPEFAKDPRNVRLGLGADGFNPFGNMSQSYSMWPVVIIVLLVCTVQQ
uniref:Transposase-associated domain-containing protein n=1 Tax=Cannabis sativa TaxID=3483 RepID=A0A803PJW4_CANSA